MISTAPKERQVQLKEYMAHLMDSYLWQSEEIRTDMGLHHTLGNTIQQINEGTYFTVKILNITMLFSAIIICHIIVFYF